MLRTPEESFNPPVRPPYTLRRLSGIREKSMSHVLARFVRLILFPRRVSSRPRRVRSALPMASKLIRSSRTRNNYVSTRHNWQSIHGTIPSELPIKKWSLLARPDRSIAKMKYQRSRGEVQEGAWPGSSEISLAKCTLVVAIAVTNCYSHENDEPSAFSKESSAILLAFGFLERRSPAIDAL